MELISELKVGQIVRKNPKAADVFSEYGIDYCCGGNVMLSEVCEKQEINFEEISQKIEKTFLITQFNKKLITIQIRPKFKQILHKNYFKTNDKSLKQAII